MPDAAGPHGPAPNDAARAGAAARPWAGRDAARSAVLAGDAHFGPGAVLAQGTVLRAANGVARIGAGSMVLENSAVVAVDGVTIGRRSVFGHRCMVIDAAIGDLCEIGNGSVLLPGSRLGHRCFLGEGTLVPAGAHFGDDLVIVGRPGRVVRRAGADDLARLTALRGGSLALPHDDHAPVTARPFAGAHMGTSYEYRGTVPTIDPTAVVFDSAELTGDVTVGPGCVIGAGVRIIGDSHGPVRIGARVQILENAVLHLLPDNELVLDDDVVIGPGCMIHGCHIGAGTIVEPAVIVCDGAVVGAGSIVRAGSLVKQRQTVAPCTVVEGFPAVVIASLDAAPERPRWGLTVADVATIARVETTAAATAADQRTAPDATGSPAAPAGPDRPTNAAG